MATWIGDGEVSGYNAVTAALEPDVYRLTAPGVLDINAITRMQYPVPPNQVTSPYPNPLWYKIKATIEFSAQEAAWARSLPGITKMFGLGFWLVPDSAIAYSGTTPTPSQIRAAEGSHQPLITNYGNVPPNNVATTHEFRIEAFSSRELNPNTKYWLLAVPGVYVQQPDGSFWGNFHPTPYSTNQVSRAISMWSNRTPAAPTITSPSTGTVLEGGNPFDLSFVSGDPDAMFGGGTASASSYMDLAGVQVQIAPQPTADNPIPEWRDMEFGNWTGESGGYPTKGWYIKGASANDPSPFGEGAKVLWETGTVSIKAGGDDANLYWNEGYLPSGNWQIRMRTWDFGHPFPDEALPFGKPPDANGTYPYTPDTAPAVNRSPWSESVFVSITSQVPPPIPLYPRDNVAISVDDMPIVFRYQYRNAAEDINPQLYRSIQIREVGETDWTDLVTKQLAVYYDMTDVDPADVPPGLLLYPQGNELVVSSEPAPDTQLIPDPDFELGTTGPWNAWGTQDGVYPADTRGPLPVENYGGSPPLPPSGSRALRISGISPLPIEWVNATLLAGATVGAGWGAVDPNGDIVCPDGSRYYSLSMWIYNDGGITSSYVDLVVFLRLRETEGGVETEYWVPVQGILGLGGEPPPPGGWSEVNVNGLLPSFDSPILVYEDDDMKTEIIGVSDNIAVAAALDYPDNQPPTGGFQQFDNTSLTLTSHVHYPFKESTEYEWRVKAWDLEVESDWSQPARFWVVPAPQSGEVKPVPSETIAGATLGCGTHRVEIYRRGGTERVGVLDGLSLVDWSRVRDDISTARIVVSGWGVDCGALLARLQTWAYEIVIFRDNGYSVDRVWEGPITLLTYEQDKVTIHAKDVMGYAYRRILKQEMSDTRNGSPITARAKRILQNVFAPDDPNVLAHLAVVSRNDDPMQYRHTPAYSRTAFEEVDDMAANAGLDYTVAGRSIVLWGTRNRIGLLPEFRDQDLGNSPIVSEYGMSMANFYAVSNGNGVYGSASRLNEDGEDPVYGLVEMLSSSWAADTADETGTFTQDALNKLVQSFEGFSERSIESRYPPPVVVRIPENTTLHPDVPITIQHLVPGVAIPLRSVNTLRSVKATQKLDSVRVVEDSSGETISITVSPFTRDDAEMIEEGGDL